MNATLHRPAFRLHLAEPGQLIEQIHEELSGLGIPRDTARRFERPGKLAGVIVDSHERIHWPSTLFLRHVSSRSNSAEGDTVRTYGECLLQWLTYLAANDIDLQDISERDVQGFRCQLLARGPDAAQPSIASAHLKLGTAIRFVRWAHWSGVVHSPLGQILSDAREQKSGARGISIRSHDLSLRLPKPRARYPVPLNVESIKQIIEMLSPPYGLVVKWALSTGLRRFEICNLRFSDLPMLSTALQKKGLQEIRLLRKGGFLQSVYVVPALIQETFWYVNFDRPSPAVGSESYIFLGRTGKKISRNEVSRRFRAAADKIGSKCTFHHLRHSFAMYVLDYLEKISRKGIEINPLKTLQILMGHASVDSTEVYLRAYDVTSPWVEAALHFLYGWDGSDGSHSELTRGS